MSGANFPRSARLVKAEQYANVFKKGRFVRKDGNVRVRYAVNRAGTPRLGVIVPKKGNRLAVRRNRLKRITRDCFRRHQVNLPSIDIIVHITAAVDDINLHRLLEQVLSELQYSA
ncbi:MAG: ribonuclease P protein component [Proteobacteria bacterium]|nr:ribonuclease P protein component [Pseudomonadota bacterium]